ncbi:hypothetical protein D3C71_1764750 [compost metagenome]
MHYIAFMERQRLAQRNQIIKCQFMRDIIIIGEKILRRPEKTLDGAIPVKLLADLADDGLLGAFTDFRPPARQGPIAILGATLDEKIVLVENQRRHTHAEQLRLAVQPDHMALRGRSHLASRSPSYQTRCRVVSGRCSISSAMK